MKALVFPGPKQDLTLMDFPDPIPGEGEILISIRAAAINHRDVWIGKGLYSGLKYPLLPGSDAAGVITGVGPGVDPSRIGEQVILNPSMNWGLEESAQQKDFKILGNPDPGTLAEFIKIDSSAAFHWPSHLSAEQAAALPLAGLTAYRALFSRAKLKTGEKVLITGIGGGVALFALQFALASGARVYVTSSNPDKLDRALQLGAHGTANYTQENWWEELRNNTGGFHVIVDGAAGPGFLSLLELAIPGGRIVNYGATRGDVPSFNLRRIFWKQLNILGSTMGSPSDFKNMIDFVQRHLIVPVIDEVFEFIEGRLALQKMNEGRQFGKIVIRLPA